MLQNSINIYKVSLKSNRKIKINQAKHMFCYFFIKIFFVDFISIFWYSLNLIMYKSEKENQIYITFNDKNNLFKYKF